MGKKRENELFWVFRISLFLFYRTQILPTESAIYLVLSVSLDGYEESYILSGFMSVLFTGLYNFFPECCISS